MDTGQWILRIRYYKRSNTILSTPEYCMQVPKKTHIIWYIFGDYLASILAWIILYFTRRSLLSEPITVNNQIFLNNRFWLGIIIIPLGWLLFYGIVGSYHSLYKKSRLN